jgi:hypothetical protein
MNIEHTCPVCDEPNLCSVSATWFRCLACKSEIEICPDAEYVDGMWRDKTTLRPLNEPTTND